MENHNIDGMAEEVMVELEDKFGQHTVFGSNHRAAVKTALTRYWKDMIIVAWHIEDVIEQARGRGIKLNATEANEILGIMKRRHDCTIGINWEVMDVHIDFFVADREKEKRNKSKEVSK
jgi:uncharacterized Fe-S center protein